jgi:hypothetical protein
LTGVVRKEDILKKIMRIAASFAIAVAAAGSAGAQTKNYPIKPDQSRRFEQRGLDVIASSPEEFSAHLKNELNKWGRVIRERGMRAE